MKVLIATLAVFATLFATSRPASAIHPAVAQYSNVPEDEKISVSLLRLEKDVQTKKIGLAKAEPMFPSVRTAGGGLIVELVLAPGTDGAALSPKLAIPGATLQTIYTQFDRAYLDVTDLAVLHQLARLAEVRMIRPQYPPLLAAGSVQSQAVVAEEVDQVFANTKFRGKYEKVGILSDSFAQSPFSPRIKDSDTTLTPYGGGVSQYPAILRGTTSQDSGDLPPEIDIRKDMAGLVTDEGAGMAELIYDIAPECEFGFYTADESPADFANGIVDLFTSARCSVLVDDVTWPDEPMYQDGVIAQAASLCVQSGIPFFSAAGNRHDLGVRQFFFDSDPSTEALGLGTAPNLGPDLHAWNRKLGRSRFLQVDVPGKSGFDAVLQWNQPSASVRNFFQQGSLGKASGIDLNLYVAASPNVTSLFSPLAIGNNVQGNTTTPAGDAFEIAKYTNFANSPVTVYIAVDGYDGLTNSIPQDPRVENPFHAGTPIEFRVVLYPKGGTPVIEKCYDDVNISLTHRWLYSMNASPTIYGHKVAPGVVSVGAVPFWEAPAFSGFFPGPVNMPSPGPEDAATSARPAARQAPEAVEPR